MITTFLRLQYRINSSNYFNNIKLYDDQIIQTDFIFTTDLLWKRIQKDNKREY